MILKRKNAWPFAVIVEFQSDTQWRTGWRPTELAENIQRNHKDLVDPKGRVPFIPPAVVHAGADVWSADDNVESLMVPPDHPDFGPYRSPARYMVHDVQREDYSAYEDNPAAAYFRLRRPRRRVARLRGARQASAGGQTVAPSSVEWRSGQNASPRPHLKDRC